MPGLVYIATDPITAFRLMDGQLGHMQRAGFDVTVITGPGSLLERAAQREGVRGIAVPMNRALSPLDDVVALARLTRTLRRLRPAIVNAGTPKAGLLGVIAARLAGVPIVVYLLRGLRFEGTRGAQRLLLAATEHVAGGLAHRVFVNSASLQQRFTALGCAPLEKTWVPAYGSSNGIDFERFASTPERREQALEKRRSLGIADDDLVVGFVGRFVRDKGLIELVEAFRSASAQCSNLRLLLVGDHDATDPLPASTRDFISQDARVVTTGFVEEPARFYDLMNVFAFPSYREGFPNAPLEAAAAGLPVVAFAATGTVDAVVDGETGRLLESRQSALLARALLEYAREPDLARRHGVAGRDRARARFSRDLVWRAIEAEYRRLLENHDPARKGANRR